MSTSESFRCRWSESNSCREDNPLTFGAGCRFQPRLTPGDACWQNPRRKNTPKLKLKAPSVADGARREWKWRVGARSDLLLSGASAGLVRAGMVVRPDLSRLCAMSFT